MRLGCRTSVFNLGDDTTKSTVRALISLATAEIAPSDDTPEGVTPDATLDSAGKEITNNHIPGQPFPVCRPAGLSRKQRRALARQQSSSR